MDTLRPHHFTSNIRPLPHLPVTGDQLATIFRQIEEAKAEMDRRGITGVPHGQESPKRR